MLRHVRLENQSLGGVVRRSGAVAMPSRRRPLPVRFAMEFGLLGALMALYLLLRFTMKGSISDAVGNAHRVVQMERTVGVFSESNLQSLALHSHDVIVFLNGYYLFAHFSMAALFFVWMLVRHPDAYPSCRRILIVMTAIGLAIHAVYPLAPPRMLPDMGFIDTGRLFGPSPYGDTSKGLANQFAAMPSLHFGWALLVAWGATRFSPSPWRRVLMAAPLPDIGGNHHHGQPLLARRGRRIVHLPRGRQHRPRDCAGDSFDCGPWKPPTRCRSQSRPPTAL